MNSHYISENKKDFVESMAKNGDAYKCNRIAELHLPGRRDHLLIEALYRETPDEKIIGELIDFVMSYQNCCSAILISLQEYRNRQKEAIEHVVDVVRRPNAEISGEGEISTRDDASSCAVDGVIYSDPDDRSQQIQEPVERLMSLVGKQPEDLSGSLISKDVRTDTSRPAGGRQVT